MQNLFLLESMSLPHPPSSRPTSSASHLPPPLSHFIHLSYAKHARKRRNTVQNHPPPDPRTHSRLHFQLFLHHHRPSHRSNTPPSQTQHRPYLASRPPRHPHADTNRTLTHSRSAFLTQMTIFLCWPSFNGIGTSTSLGLG
ncbi:hypothetical protein K443DRAFT_641020 [Laccaria amethystina LaAM-08-1]|uniref:Uncharacterized protein n=1 Tax=Laccaria amethystina LaAM-08-1 TaxID=1095629 RepID=A0A0C9XAE9_9AGAR|nr:hypothetical protein K443DRAFT_641020 [Laccaria amethystina LaAM-08-1]